MRVLHFIRNNPVTISCVVLVGLNVWVALQLLEVGTRPLEPRVGNVPQHLQVANEKAKPAFMFHSDAVAPEMIADMPLIESPRPRIAVVSAAALPKLKPGMTRAEVEGMLGAPPADQIHAITVNAERITYRTTYELSESELPMTVRPIQSRTRVPARPADPLSFVALEFDASLPGHPLVGVLYPDPLF